MDIFLQLSHNKINVGQREGVLVTSDQMTLIYYPDAPETCFAVATHKAAVNKKVNVLVCYTIFPLCGFHWVTYKKWHSGVWFLYPAQWRDQVEKECENLLCWRGGGGKRLAVGGEIRRKIRAQWKMNLWTHTLVDIHALADADIHTQTRQTPHWTLGSLVGVREETKSGGLRSVTRLGYPRTRPVGPVIISR